MSTGEPQDRFRWLLIFDNVDDSSHVEPYLPQATKGSVIMTSKRADIAYRFASSPLARILLEPFSIETGSRFLLSLVKEAAVPSRDDTELACKVSRAVGNHPLALDLLGSYMRKCNKSLRRFIQEHPTYDRAFIFQPGLAQWTENAYLRFVSNTWAMSLSAGDTRFDSSARLLIQMLAFLDADDVPVSLIKENDGTKMQVGEPQLED